MRKVAIAAALAAMLLSACTTDGSSPQTAVPATPRTLAVYDFLAPNQARTVTPDWAAINAQPLGSKGNPVRTLMPTGQQAYLSRLLCPDGSRPAFRRIGSDGTGPYTTIVDTYDVRCGGTGRTVYLDMYHPGYVEQRAVPGFTIRPPAGS